MGTGGKGGDGQRPKSAPRAAGKLPRLPLALFNSVGEVGAGGGHAEGARAEADEACYQAEGRQEPPLLPAGRDQPIEE